MIYFKHSWQGTSFVSTKIKIICSRSQCTIYWEQVAYILLRLQKYDIIFLFPFISSSLGCNTFSLLFISFHLWCNFPSHIFNTSILILHFPFITFFLILFSILFFKPLSPYFICQFYTSHDRLNFFYTLVTTQSPKVCISHQSPNYIILQYTVQYTQSYIHTI